MKVVEENKLELIFEVLVAEQCWSGTEVALQHCSATKTTKMLSRLFSSKFFM